MIRYPASPNLIGLVASLLLVGTASATGTDAGTDAGTGSEPNTSPPAASLPSVPTAEPALPEELAQIRGLLKPVHEATLGAEILGRVTELPFREGERFKKDDVLVRFDCARHEAELGAARAAYSARKDSAENKVELAKYNAAAQLEVDVSKAEADQAAAQIAVARANVRGCVIKAPWDGRVVETLVHPHETVAAGRELLKILDDSALEVELIVPSRWLRWLKVETPFRFSVDETGGQFDGTVSRLGASVDPVSKTIRVIGRIGSAQDPLLAGMSGTAHFDLPQQATP